jgi:hypothetical protein
VKDLNQKLVFVNAIVNQNRKLDEYADSTAVCNDFAQPRKILEEPT